VGCFLSITQPVGSINFLDGENWSTIPSVEDLAFIAITRLLLRVDRDVEELAITVALALESRSLAIGILEAVPFIEWRPRLDNLEISATQPKFERFELAGRYSENVGGLRRTF